MNSITRLILHRLASGKVRLTPIVIEVLREVSTDCPPPEPPESEASESAPSPDESAREKSDTEKHLTFINPLPGRWIRRMSCAAGSALLLAAGMFQAMASPDTFEAANNAYAQGNYDEATKGFESVVVEHGYSASVLYNLANAQQRARQFGPAILNYERAALLSPNDPDIAANLGSARQQAGVEMERPSPIQRIARTFTLNAWFGLAAGAVFLIALALALKQLWPQARRTLNLGSGLATFALVISVSALIVRVPDLRRAVVTAPEAVAGISPVTAAQPVFKLRAGEVVTWQQAHGDFALVKNRAGHEGWVKVGKIQQVTPPATDSGIPPASEAITR